jgi:hypothetical protein
MQPGGKRQRCKEHGHASDPTNQEAVAVPSDDESLAWASVLTPERVASATTGKNRFESGLSRVGRYAASRMTTAYPVSPTLLGRKRVGLELGRSVERQSQQSRER